MKFVKDRIKTLCNYLERYSKTEFVKVNDLEYLECDYKNDNNIPESGYIPMASLSGAHKHYWIHCSFKTGPLKENCWYMLNISTGHSGWDTANPQGMLYLNGEMVQGIDLNHTEAFLQPDTQYDMHLYLYSSNVATPFDLSIQYYLLNREVENLYYDILTPLEALDFLNENTKEYFDILNCLEQASNIVDIRLPFSQEFYQSVTDARRYLEEEFYSKKCTTTDKPTVHCIGHTHIDVEWLWSRRQTKEKIQRSFATANALMEKYPEYLFTLSQPQLYIYLKEEAPEKYAQLKQLVKDERWEPEGAMFLEADCNLISGESFVRQIMHGKKFFKDEFGVDSKVLFLPDVFGYSAALPQILKKSGIDYFVTSKISWNDYDQMPVDSFMWRGIDGSRIFSTFITGRNASKNHATDKRTTYVGMLDASCTMGTWDRYQQKEFNTNVILTYGFGDGGGGPTRSMLEKQRRLERGLPGMPKTKLNFLKKFLAQAETEFKTNAQKLGRTPEWVGELYLEFHRGTYTSIAKNKRANRKCEFGLQQAEAMSVTDLLNGGTYDSAGIYKAWQMVLHNQFHDILPGSSIHEVYEGTDADYKYLDGFVSGIIGEKLNKIASNVATEGGTLVYNPTGFVRSGSVKLDDKTVYVENIPAYGWRVATPSTENTVTVNGLTAENKYYIITLNESGMLTSVYDKSALRQVLSDVGNQLQVFEDIPNVYDAWEIREYYKSKMYILDQPAVITPVTDGVRSGFRVEKKHFDSTIVQHIWLYSDDRRIDFENDIDWHQHHQLLKIAFPIDVHTDKASFEIQFGHIERATHSNTSWDEARFEVCAHKWVDVSENGYGVSLLNDCKYGFNIEDTTIKLTAIKSATHPDPDADQGMHKFTYSLLPHSGALLEANVVKEAYSLNVPLMAVNVNKQNGALPASFSLVSVDMDNVIIDTVKKAEASNGLVVRMYEAYNRRTNATVTLGKPFTKAYICDLMENPLQQIDITDNTVTVPVKNFEIVTLKFE